jgi:leukotriene-A4 hydrolase
MHRCREDHLPSVVLCDILYLSATTILARKSSMAAHDPHSYVKPQQATIKHIDFKLNVDFPSKTIQGQAVYHLDKSLKGSLYLDNRKVQIVRIHTDGKDIEWEMDKQDPIRGQRLHLKRLKGICSFVIDFVTDPQADALQWLSPQQTLGGEHPYLFSQCQAINARSIFPCQDSPSIRFTYSAEVVVPRPMIAVMAAAPQTIQTEGDLNRCRFEMPQPIPSYLFALAVGKLSSRELGPRCRIYAEEEIVEDAAWEFAETEDKLIEAEKMLGPYEWERYDLLVMPPSFPYGGMENPRLTFLTPTVIVGNRSYTHLVTHEMAHSWTGNLITNATWEDFWLNEGWTTYVQMRIDEVLQGRDYAQMKIELGRGSMFAAMQRFGMESENTKLNYDMSGVDPDDVFSTVPYYKGQAFLEKLENAVGRERFDAFISKYIESFKFQSLSTEAFLSFLKQQLPEAVKAVDVKKWIYKPGFPDDAPQTKSKLIDEVDACVAAYRKGKLPTGDEVRNWNPDQVNLFLRRVMGTLPLEHSRHFEKIFDLSAGRDYALLSQYLALAVRSGDEEILPRIEAYIEHVGRGIFLRPIVQAMAETAWSRDLVRPIVERYRDCYHPLTVRLLERILTEAGV